METEAEIDDIDRLDLLIKEGVVSVDQAAGELGVSRTTLSKWRRRAVALKYINVKRLAAFLDKHGSNAGSRTAPLAPQTGLQAREGTGVQMRPEHAQMLLDILSLPPQLQTIAAAQLRSLAQLARNMPQPETQTEKD